MRAIQRLLGWRGDWFDWYLIQITAVLLAFTVLASGVVLGARGDIPSGQPARQAWHRSALPWEEAKWKRDQQRAIEEAQRANRGVESVGAR